MRVREGIGQGGERDGGKKEGGLFGPLKEL